MATPTHPPTKTIGTPSPSTTYTPRHAVRTILLDPSNQTYALLHIAKGNYHKLPGGGIEASEDHALAAAREALEETGCVVKVRRGCIGTVEEWRGDLHQVSWCYVAEVVERGEMELTEEEKGEGLVCEWVGIGEVVKKMKGIEPTSELGRSVKERDVFLVETYLGILDGRGEVRVGGVGEDIGDKDDGGEV